MKVENETKEEQEARAIRIWKLVTKAVNAMTPEEYKTASEFMDLLGIRLPNKKED